jgi:hypothetical protein
VRLVAGSGAKGGGTLDQRKKCQGRFYFFCASKISGWVPIIFFGKNAYAKPHAMFARTPFVGKLPGSCARPDGPQAARLEGRPYVPVAQRLLGCISA